MPTRTDVAILIPTCSDQPGDLRIGYTLNSLAMQDFAPLSIYVRDEGQFGIFNDRNIRMIWDYLSSLGFELHYHRTDIRRGVGFARYQLVQFAAQSPYVMFIDDDMLLRPETISRLIAAATKYPDAGFFQGTKIQIDPSYRYLNDINQLNGQHSVEELIPIVFGDAACLLLQQAALSLVDWELVTRYPVPGLPGEDVLITLMIADKMPAWGVPDAVAYHLSPIQKRWRWEVSSDLLQLELLQNRVSTETLAKALPHLQKYIRLSCKDETTAR